MRWKNKTFLIQITLISLLLVQFSVWFAKAPSYPNNISIGSGIRFIMQHSETVNVHRCDSSSGWVNVTRPMTFSTDTENFTQGVASVKAIIDFGVASTSSFRSETGLGVDISGKDFLDWYIRTNGTISNYYFILVDSGARQLYWQYAGSISHASFTLYELDLSNPTFEHASFDRTDISYLAFQCNGANFVTVWTDYVSASVWQHSYVTQTADSYHNVTLDGDVLTVSKDLDELSIECATEDRVTIELYSWFSSLTTRLRPYSPVSSSFTFDINARSYGEPQGISGVSSWSFDEATTTLTFSCANASMVVIRFADLGTRQTLWYLDRMLMWLGIGGIGMMMFSPIMCVFFLKKGELSSAFVWGLMLFIIGMGLMIGWLWG